MFERGELYLAHYNNYPALGWLIYNATPAFWPNQLLLVDSTRETKFTQRDFIN